MKNWLYLIMMDIVKLMSGASLVQLDPHSHITNYCQYMQI